MAEHKKRRSVQRDVSRALFQPLHSNLAVANYLLVGKMLVIGVVGEAVWANHPKSKSSPQATPPSKLSPFNELEPDKLS